MSTAKVSNNTSYPAFFSRISPLIIVRFYDYFQRDIHQFVLHASILAYIIARYAAGEIRPRYVGLWVFVLVISILAVPIYLVDLKFGANFMFLTNHTNNPVLKLLWNLSGGNGGLPYVFALVIFITLLLHILFGIFTLIGHISKKA